MDKTTIITEAVRLLKAEGAWATLQFIALKPDPEQAADDCNAVLAHLYWQKHDLAAVIGLGLPAIQRTLMQADLQGQRGAQLRHLARHFAYNIASYSWIGWDEPDIIIDATAQAIGYDAARLNLDLICKYEPEPLKLARGHAMLGYHLLARDEYNAALENFMASAEHAGAAAASAEQKLALAFVALTRHVAALGVSSTEQQRTDQQLMDALNALDGAEGSHAFKTQIETAKQVFTGRAR